MSYVKTQWVNGDTITAAKLNNIEGGIETHDEDISLVKSHLEAGLNTLSDDKTDIGVMALFGVETAPDPSFTFATNGTDVLSGGHGSYVISGQSSVTNAVAAYTQIDDYNAYTIAAQQYIYSNNDTPAATSIIFPFYKNGNDLYGFRFTNASTIVIQRYNVSTFSGGTITSVSKTHGWTGGKVLTIYRDSDYVYLYIENKLVFQYNYASLVSDDGMFVAGYICSAYYRPMANDGKVSFSRFRVFNAEFNANVVTAKAENALNAANNAEKQLCRGYHFSFDDVITVFQDLTTNAGTYTSIFDNAFLNDLKTLHESYGACVSLYCFYSLEDGTFTLSDATNAFAAEFTANSDWLRFGFHSYMQGVAYGSGATREAQIKTDYDTTITELVRITGSIDCIDRMPRLQNYAGSLTACKAIRDTNCGVVGLLASSAYSDSQERDSYYFSTEQNDYMAKHYKYYDAENMLTFLKTSYGINSNSKATAYITTADKANMRDFVEVFLHENQWTSGMFTMWQGIANVFTGAGYKSAFYMDRLI